MSGKLCQAAREDAKRATILFRVKRESLCGHRKLRGDRHSSTFPHYRRGSPSVPLTMLLAASETEYNMARYSAFLGRRVEVQYRAGDILLPASGTFVADSGRSIFLEQHFEQRGSEKHFRWEIPYQYIVRLEEKAELTEAPASSSSASSHAPAVAPSADPLPASAETKVQGRSDTTTASGGASAILPLQNRPKTA